VGKNPWPPVDRSRREEKNQSDRKKKGGCGERIGNARQKKRNQLREKKKIQERNEENTNPHHEFDKGESLLRGNPILNERAGGLLKRILHSGLWD